MTDHPPAEQQPDELAELRTENAKLIRWHREDEKALAEMRDTIEYRRAEQAARTVPDTLPAWLYQRFAVIHGAPAWDRVADDQRAYWEHQARAVRRAVARGGFKAVAPDAASEVTSAPLQASQPSSVSESAQSPTGAAEGAPRASRAPGIPQPVEDLAAADNPTHLRWGLNDVLWSDDDSVIVLLSGPDREAYWLELDPERAAVLREDLAGPAGEQQDKARCAHDIETALGTYPCERDADHDGDCDERTEAEYAAALRAHHTQENPR